MDRNRFFYLSAVLGAVFLMLLRFFDEAGILTALLAVAGLTLLVYSMRHTRSKKEYFALAGIIAVIFLGRFYGMTGGSVVDIFLGLLIGLIVFALMGLERLFRKYEDRFWYTLIFPTAYLVFLYLTELIKINMPFRMDVYLSDLTALCQITAMLGIYSLDFLLAWTASALAFFLDHRKEKQGCVLAVIYVCAMCAVICFGFAHLKSMETQEAKKNDTVRVAMATGPYYGTITDASYADFTMEETLTSLRSVISDAANDNAEILVFSEEAFCVYDTDEEVLLARVKEMASGNDLHILLAYEVEDTDGSGEGKGTNKLCWISSEGEILYEYVKHCLVPVVEASQYVRGDKMIEPFTVDVHGKSLKVATAICYDGDFELFMSHMGKNVDLLLLPTWDWNIVAEEHFSVARLRAISSETTLVRSVYDGWNAVIDSAGNVLLRENTNDTGYENVLVFEVPVR